MNPGSFAESHEVDTETAQNGTYVRVVASGAWRTMRCMDRASLEQLLDSGLSLAAIGRRFDKDPSTVGYWVKKHGLRAIGSEKYAPRGGCAGRNWSRWSWREQRLSRSRTLSSAAWRP